MLPHCSVRRRQEIGRDPAEHRQTIDRNPTEKRRSSPVLSGSSPVLLKGRPRFLRISPGAGAEQKLSRGKNEVRHRFCRSPSQVPGSTVTFLKGSGLRGSRFILPEQVLWNYCVRFHAKIKSGDAKRVFTKLNSFTPLREINSGEGWTFRMIGYLPLSKPGVSQFQVF